jgi:hypothetical protein
VRKAQTMNGWIGVTNDKWLALLFRQPGIDEVNFWKFRA